MVSPDKNRFCIFLVFIILLIAFGVFYRPADASGGPAPKNARPVTSSGK